MKKIIPLFILLSVGCATSYKTENPPAGQLTPKTQDPLKADSSGYVKVNGIEMYYEISGVGQPLVVLHGGGSDMRVSFGRGIPELAKNYRVIAFDEQSHGKTKHSDRKFGFEQTADDIAAALKELKIENAYFLGFSNGATTGMQLAIRHPGVIKKMVLGSGLYQRAGAPKQFWDGMKKGSLENMPQDLKDAYKKNAVEPQNLDKMFMVDANRMKNFKDIPVAVIKKVSIPTLIIQNDQDVPTPEHAVKTAALMPGGRVAILIGMHDNFLGDVSPDNKPMRDAYLAVVREFLK